MDIVGTGGGQGNKVVAAAATPVQLIATRTICASVIVSARPGNTGKIAVGFSNAVRATAGAEVGAILSAGQSLALMLDDVSKVWIDASVNGEGVGFAYLDTRSI